MAGSIAERRRDFARDEVARIAIELFDRDGYERVNVEHIAQAAGISVRTFFRYFPSKEDVVLHEHATAQLRLRRALDARPQTEGPIAALRQAFVESATILPEGRARVLQYGRVQSHTPVLAARAHGARTTADDDVVASLARRMGVDPRRDVRPAMVVTAMSAVAGTAFLRWVDRDGRGDLAADVAAAIDLLIDGLTTLDTKQPDTKQPDTKQPDTARARTRRTR